MPHREDPDFSGPDFSGRLHDPVQPGQIAVLRVADINDTGVFLDQGLAKQLLLPHTELHSPVRIDDRVVVIVLEDKQGRPYASNKLTRHLDFEPWGLRPGAPVSLRVYGQNERGFLCIVEGRHAGMLFRDRTHQPVAMADELRGYVVETHPDGKIDVSLRKPGVDHFTHDRDMLQQRLRAEGFLPLHDKSPPAEIRAQLGMSKKAFKRAVGALYKQRKIVFDVDGIHWVADQD